MAHRMAVVSLLGLLACQGGETTGDTAVPDETPEPLDLAADEAPFALDGATFYDDVPYGDDERNRLDLFLPDGVEGPMPLLVDVHGGGFTGGTEEDLYHVPGGPEGIAELLASGVAVASVEYRLLDEVDHEGVIKPMGDVRRAVQFLRWHHEELGLDPDRVAGRGISAGAGTVLWLGVHDDMADPAADDPVARQSTRLSVVHAIETQATYDLLGWEDVFAEYGITIDLAAQLGLEQFVLSFYGMDAMDELYTEPVVSYRADVDMLGLLSADDPAVRVENTYYEDSYPLDLGALYHHPNHARFVRDAALAVGGEVQAVIPKQDIDDSDGETGVAFLLRHL
ncbi:MAG: hypothetical protein R3F59_00970 [Myxococcota bacterium]